MLRTECVTPALWFDEKYILVSCMQHPWGQSSKDTIRLYRGRVRTKGFRNHYHEVWFGNKSIYRDTGASCKAQEYGLHQCILRSLSGIRWIFGDKQNLQLKWATRWMNDVQLGTGFLISQTFSSFSYTSTCANDPWKFTRLVPTNNEVRCRKHLHSIGVTK